MRRFGRIGLAAMAIVALAGCKDVGLQGNIPLAQARVKPPPPLVAQTTPIGPQVVAKGMPESVRLDSTTWAPVSTTRHIMAADSDVHEVGTVGGMTFYALRWDSAPYDFLLAKKPDGSWLRYDRVR